MTKKKVAPVLISGKVEIKGVVTSVRPKVDKKKVKSRGPGQVGQARIKEAIGVNGITGAELAKRVARAASIIATGKEPAKDEKKGDAPKKEADKKEEPAKE